MRGSEKKNSPSTSYNGLHKFPPAPPTVICDYGLTGIRCAAIRASKRSSPRSRRKTRSSKKTAMASEVKKEIQLEIAHVLFIDIVGYSKLSINEQGALVDTLNQIVRGTEEFRSAEAAGRLIKIPTGDGMALVFYSSAEAPAQCAVE